MSEGGIFVRQHLITRQACETEDSHTPPIHRGEITQTEGGQPLAARFMLADGQEFSCTVTNLHRGGALFLSAEPIPEGMSLIAYVEGLGRVEGKTGETVDGGFPVHFALTGPRLARLEQNLRWLSLRQQGLASEQRHGTRFAPHDGHARITLVSGEEHACEVMDISLSGAAIKCGVRPEPGSCVHLGKTRGRVIRHLADGFALEFIAPLESAELRHGLS